MVPSPPAPKQQIEPHIGESRYLSGGAVWRGACTGVGEGRGRVREGGVGVGEARVPGRLWALSETSNKEGAGEYY